MDLMTHPEVLYERPGYFGEVTVVDDSTLKIIEGEPGLDEVYFPRHLLEHLDPAKFYEWDFWKKPVGNGPYRFVRHEPHTMVELEANPDHYDGGPRIRRVILKFSQAAGLPELLSGAVDAIWAADPADVPKLGTDARFRVSHSLAASWVQQLIYWKTDHPLFRDRRVRRALTLAIDRRLLIRAVNLPEIIPVIDGYYSRRQLARGGVPEPLPHDPGEALRLLESAGWRDADGDGVRERGGKEFRFTALTPTAYNLSQIALLVQDQLRRVGVRMEIQMFEAAVVQHRLEAGEFEVVVGWNGGGQLWNVLHLGEGPPLGYENSEIAELGKPDTFDPAELDRRKRRIAEIIQEDLPVTFLFPAVGTFIVHRRIRGLSSPWQADPLRHMDELWIEEGG
jgi:peptide/nickel transport system substrate-binding protein